MDSRTKRHYLDLIAMSLAGMAAEDVFLGGHDDGAAGNDGSDLVEATKTATALERTYGMGAKLASYVHPARYPDGNFDPMLLPRVDAVLQEQLDRAKAIRRDIGELVADENGLIPNVYQIIWRPEAIEKHPPDQSIFAVEGREFRIRAIHTNDFDWIFKALKSQSALTSINPKLVRALAARTMKLIRHDIPSGSVQVDYDVLERVAGEKDFLPKLLGITVIDNPISLTLTHRIRYLSVSACRTGRRRTTF